MAGEITQQSFFAQWRQRVQATIPEFKARIAQLGIFGVAAASIAILAQDPSLAAFSGAISGLAGNFVADAVLRWRNARDDAERDELLKQIAEAVAAQRDNPQVQAVFQELNLVAASIAVIGDKIDVLTELVKVGFATQQQVINTGGGANISGNVNTGGGAFVGRDQNIFNLPPPPSTFLHQLPQPPRDFTGRADELAELLAAVETGGVTISGLRGMGGVGKTTLALKLAEQLTLRYPDAQFYLDLRGASPMPLTPAEVMAHVVRSYDRATKLPESETELSALYRTKLHGQRALVLLDNAASNAQVDALIPPLTCLLIVTSRQHFTLPGLYAKDLDKLPLPDARTLLLKIAPRIADHADEFARLCDCLPQALRLVASALAERSDLSPGVYLRRLADATQRLKLTGTDALLSLSYDLLSAALQSLWCQLAVFPGDFDMAAAAAVWALDDDLVQDTLSELVRYSLVEHRAVAGSEQGRYHLHDLARLFAVARLGEQERRAAELRHAKHYLAVLRSADQLYMQGNDAILRGLALFDQEWAHIQAGQAWAATHTADDDAARLCIEYPSVGIFCLSLRLHPRGRICWLRTAVDVAYRLKDRPAEGNALGNLGLAYADLGDSQYAIEFYWQALMIYREIRDRYNEGVALDSLGLVYADIGDSQHAIEFYKQSLKIAREIGDRRSEGVTLGNFGSVYYGVGEVRKAIEFYEQALKIAREIGDRHGEGRALGNLGVAYADLEDSQRAIEFHQQHLTIAQKMGDRRGEGNALGNLGIAFESIGGIPEALNYADRALAIFTEIESPYASEAKKLVDRLRAQGAGKPARS